jgi:hypothetical protein
MNSFHRRRLIQESNVASTHNADGQRRTKAMSSPTRKDGDE